RPSPHLIDVHDPAVAHPCRQTSIQIPPRPDLTVVRLVFAEVLRHRLRGLEESRARILEPAESHFRFMLAGGQCGQRGRMGHRAAGFEIAGRGLEYLDGPRLSWLRRAHAPL